MSVLHNNDFMHLIWKIYYYELVTGMEKDILVSHKGQGAETDIFFTGKLFTWWFIIVVLVYLGLFLIYIKYLKLLTIENTVLIFQFYK
jgi:hypothetical protein